MSIVDNRVVKMTFDNANFEKNLKTTMDSLSKFEKSLKLDGATAGFDALKKATDKLNLSVIGDKATTEAQRIDKMATDARKSIDGIDDAAQDADFSALSNAAGDAVNDINVAAENTDFSPASNAAQDAAVDINNAASSVDLSPISDSAEQASESFKALEMVAAGVLLGIGEKIAGLATGGLSSIGNKIKEYTFDPITDGFKEYETQMGSIQTIMANTGMDFNSDEDIATVNAALDELNTYADKTIYNFTEMTRNIGTFTAAGIKLEPATKAIQGIANLAALSGSNSQQASTAMYQLSQALAAGSLKLQDWNSVVNAGMGGKVFQEALKETARVHGFAVDEMIADAGSFRESLSDGWITSEILTETLNHMAISYERVGDESYEAAKKQMIDTGYTEDQAVAILKLAKQAEESATKVRTWTQLWDTVKEAIGSSWGSVFRNLIGDFKQATDTFTFFSKNITEGVDGLLGGIVHAAERFNQSGGISIIFGGYKRDKNGEDVFDKTTNQLVRIKGAVDYLAEAIGKPLGAIKDAFDKIFGIGDEELDLTIVSFALAFKDLAKSLVISDDAADGLRRIFEGLFAVLDIGIHLILDLGAAFFGVIKVLRIFIDPLIDLALVIGGQLGLAVVWVHDKILELRSAFVYMLTPITTIASAFGQVISSALGFSTIKDLIENIRYAVLNVLEFLWKLIDIPGKMGAFGDFLNEILGINSAIDGSQKALEHEGKTISATDILVQRLLKNPVIAFFAGIASAVKKAFGWIVNAIKSIGDLVAAFNNSEEAFSMMDGLKNLLGGIGSILGSVASSIGSLFGKIGSAVVPVISSIFEFLKNLATGVGSVALKVIGALALALVAIGTALFEVGKAIAGVIASGFPVFISEVIKLGQAIGGLIGRLWDFFVAWEPIQGIIKMAQEFKTKVVDFFTSIPSRFQNLGSSIFGNLTDAESSIGGMVSWFEKLTNAINNMSAEQFVSTIKNGFVGAIGKIQTTIDNLKSLNFEKVAGRMVNNLQSIKGKLIVGLSDINRFLKNAFPSLAPWIQKNFGKALTTLTSMITRIQNIIVDAKKNSKDMPTFIGKLIGDIASIIISGAGKILSAIGTTIGAIAVGVGTLLLGFGKFIYANIHAIVSGEGLSKIASLWSSFGKELGAYVGDSIRSINPSFGELYDKITGFFSSITSESSGWRVALSTAIDTVKEKFKELPGQVSKALGDFKTLVLDSLEKAFNKLSYISGPVGDFFGTIRDRISGAREEVKIGSSEIPNNMNTMVSGIKQKIRDLGNALKEFFVGTEESDDKGFIGRLVNFFSGAAGKLIGKVTSIPGKFGEFLDSVIKAFTPERIEKIKNIIALVAKIRLFKSLRELFTGLGKLSKAFARRMSKKDTESIRERMRDWAITFAIIAAALWVISTIPDPWSAVGVVAALGGLLLALTGVSALIQKFIGKSGGEDLLKAAGALAILAIAIRMMLKTVEILNEFDYEKNATGLAMFAAFMAGFWIWTQILGNGGKNAIQAAAGLLIMSIALRMLIGPIKEIANFTKDMSDEQLAQAGKGLAAVAVFIVALGGAMRLAGKNALKSGVAFVLMGVAIGIIADSIVKVAELAHLDIGAALVALGGILAIIGAFAAIAKFIEPKNLLAAGASFLILSASISIITDAVAKLVILSKINMDGLVTAFEGILILMVVFGAMAKAVEPKRLLAAGAAMVIFSAAVGIIALALSKLATLNADKLKTAALAIGGIVTVFGLLAIALSAPPLAAASATVLPLLSLALISLGAACLLIGLGLEHAVNGIIQLALASPILAEFVNTISANVGNFILAAVGIGALGAAFAIFGPTAVIAGAGIWLLANGIRDFLILMIELPVLLPLAADAFGKVFNMIIQNAGGFVPKLAEWWNTSAWPWLQEKFAQAKSYFFNTILPMISNFLLNVLPVKAGEFIAWLQAWWAENWPRILQKVVEFKDNIVTKLKELVPKLKDWVMNELIPKAKDKVVEIVEKIKEKFGEKLKAFIDDIPGMAQTALDNISESIKDIGKNIAAGIAEGVRAGAEWVVAQIQALTGAVPTTAEENLDINSPSRVMRDRVGRYIPEGMAVGIREFSGAVISATKSLAEDTTSALDSELNKAKYSIPSPSISPIANMSGIASDISEYNRMLQNTMVDGNVRLSNGLTGEMSLSAALASRLDDDMSRTDSLASSVQDIQTALYSNMAATEDLYNRTNTILAVLSSDASSIRESLAGGMNLYMDKSTLVGAIAPEMDDILGRRAILAGRGVY